MNMTRILAPLGSAAVMAMILAAGAPAALAQSDAQTHATAAAQVSVRYAQPQSFAEALVRRGHPLAGNDDYLATLQNYIQARASRELADHQRLQITITDLKLAGDFRGGDSVRTVRVIDAPRIDLRFKLLAADGSVLRHGTRKLRDPAFLNAIGISSNQRALPYTKALIDHWLSKGAMAL